MVKKAVLIIDYINEIASNEGKLSSKGYVSFMNEHDTISNLNFRIKTARENDELLLFVSVGFDKFYINQPKKFSFIWKSK